MKLLKELTQAWGVAGRERNIRTIIKREIEGFCDEMFTDAVGNLIAVKYGARPSRQEKNHAGCPHGRDRPAG